tara:strand:+ start:266 stop:676 length:411 start_codon:yes stop_codon:yes gene_type:complete
MMARPMNYKDEEKELWDDFTEYREHLRTNPRSKVEYVGKDGERVDTPLVTPLTVDGFENFVYDKRGFSIHDYMYSTEDRYKRFSTIRSRVKSVVRQDQIEGGMVGQYNASITQRLNGLADKTETKDTTEPRVFKID